MENFVWTNPTMVYFGRGFESFIGDLVKKYSDRLLIVTYSKEFLDTIEVNGIIEGLSEIGISTICLYGITPNPKLSFVKEGIDICKKENIGFVLGIGGGSVIDATKAIAFGACYDGDVWDFFENKNSVKKTLPTGNVLTLASAGSETNWSCVVTNDDTLVKGIVNSHLIHPMFSIMNPELMLSAPIEQIKYGIADIYSHFIERYFTRSLSEITTGQCEAAMRSVIHIADKFRTRPLTYDMCAELMWAGKISQDDSLEVGKVVDWTSHILSHQVGVMFKLPHAIAISIIMSAWLLFAVGDLDLHKQFKRYAKEVFGIKDTLKGVYKTKEFFKKLNLPVTFKEAGIDLTEEVLKKIVEEFPNGLKRENAFYPLEKKDIETIFRIAKGE